MSKNFKMDDNVKLEILRLDNEGISMNKISELVGINKSTVSRFLRKLTHKEWWERNDNKPIASGNYKDHHAKIEKLPGNRFILTSAQNNTYVHPKFLKSLENAAEYMGAQILVGTFSYNIAEYRAHNNQLSEKYKNRETNQNLEKGDNLFFDPMIKEYIVDEPKMLTKDLMWNGELNISPTAVNPFSGMEGYTKGISGIFPHVKVGMKPLARHKMEDPRYLFSTGSITKKNYIQKKAGQKGALHHTFAALLIEVDEEGDWFPRQLVADSGTGEFYDLDVLYTPEGVFPGQSVEAIQWGDLHSEKADEEVYKVSFGNHPDSLLNRLNPTYQFVNDVLDFTSRNHHNIKDPYFRFKRYIEGKESVLDDIKQVADTLEMMKRDSTITVIVESNHDLALQRWLKESDYKSDPANSIPFLELQLATYKALESGDDDFSIFEYAMNKYHGIGEGSDYTIFLREDESFKICGSIESGCHGHLGNNGGRGSVSAFKKRGIRYNVGHGHSPCIDEGVYYAGVSGKLEMGYNKGGTTWDHGHIITYPNGKRSIYLIRNGKYYAKP